MRSNTFDYVQRALNIHCETAYIHAIYLSREILTHKLLARAIEIEFTEFNFFNHMTFLRDEQDHSLDVIMRAVYILLDTTGIGKSF